jgi:hypothetical protein
MKTPKGKWFLTFIVITLVLLMTGTKFAEKYRSVDTDYKYGFVDTNPTRRTGQFFDTCSPENMVDCKRNNPYKGLPLP